AALEQFRQGRGKAAVGDVRRPLDELRVRHGSADIHPGARDRRGLRHAVFSFQDLDCTKPAGSVKIRVETIAHYLECHSPRIIREKLARVSPVCPLMAEDTAS